MTSAFSGEQRGLEFDPPLSKVEREFRAWLKTPDGRYCLSEVKRCALKLLGAGFKHYGIGAIWESMRYDWAVRVGPDQDGLKLNDHHRSFLAREVMRMEPKLESFFETRTLRGRQDFGAQGRA